VDSFAAHGETVWAAEGGENVPGRFFRQGVRQLVLHPGLTPAEFEQLVMIMLSNAEHGGDDVLDQLFGAAFQHLTYVVADLVSFGELTELQVAEEVHRITEDLKRRYEASTPEGLAQAEALGRKIASKLPPQDPGRELVDGAGTATPAFRERLSRELEADGGGRLRTALVVFALTRAEQGSLGTPQQTIELVTQLCESFLADQDLGSLGRVFAFLDARARSTEVTRQLADQLPAWIGTEPHLKQLLRALAAPAPEWVAAARCLSACPPSASRVLLDGLATLEAPTAHALVLEAVAGIDPTPAATLAARLPTEWAKIVPHLMGVSERLPTAERVQLVLAAMHHPNPKLQLEVLKLLPQAADKEKVYALALEATASKSAEVRAEAFRTLGRLVPKRAARDLARLQRLPDWDKRDQAEQELIFDCLGATNADEAFDAAVGLLQVPKKGLFAGSRIPMKLLAIRSLQHMPRPQARTALQSVGTMPHQDAEATEAARRALLRPPAQAAKPPESPAAAADLTQAIDVLRRCLANRKPQAGAPPDSGPSAAPPRPSAPVKPVASTAPSGGPSSATRGRGLP
jgi:hypothetical protein